VRTRLDQPAPPQHGEGRDPFVVGVPTPIMAVAGSYIILTVVGVVLTLADLRRPALASAH
jgi:hypothetical protein